MTAQLIRELERTRDETLQYFSLGAGDLARTYAPGKWSVRYILHHLSDSEIVFLDRISRVLSEPRPVLWVMDQDGGNERMLALLPGPVDGRVQFEPDYLNNGWLEEQIAWSW